MNFKKLGRAIFIGHYSLQILKVSCDLEILVDFVVEIPWNTTYASKASTVVDCLFCLETKCKEEQFDRKISSGVTKDLWLT